MMQLEFIEGKPKSNVVLTRFARRAVRLQNWRKTNYVPLLERRRLDAATVRETTAEEVARRFKEINRELIINVENS